MDWETIKAVAAIYAAGLSTIVACVQWFSSRPLFLLEPEPLNKVAASREGFARIRIVNPSSRPLVISSLKQWGSRQKIGLFPQRADDKDATRRWIEFALEGRFQMYVAPKSEALIRVNGLKGQRRAMFAFIWHRGWMLPIRFARFLYVSAERVGELNAGALQYEDS